MPFTNTLSSLGVICNMKSKSFSSLACYISFLLQVMSSASEKLMVTMPAQHVVAIAGGQAELTCQLSPPRSAELMEIHWFRGDHSKPVYLYRGGREENREADPEYVGRVEFVKETIGEGQVTLRINNISISDEGSYQCSFEDNGFSDMAILNLSVAAIGLDTQIRVQAANNKRLLIECKSEGWYPQPKMEWRDSRGEEVPHSSISYSQDGAKLFHMKMTLLLQNKSRNSITCCIYNSLTAHEKKVNIILASALFDQDHIWPKILMYLLNTIFFIAAVYIFFLYIESVSIEDPLFDLYNSWMWDMTLAMGVMIGFIIIMLAGFLCYTIIGPPENRAMKLSKDMLDIDVLRKHSLLL
ncbi:selection and upkeep of intraepithelial T-cells protein 8-like [Ochotona curzoniae]|uniref:selection and upkeep of intraepithelial T-cells protein 8-like n=1 Tax=Ochotona curzoniae TaxID=130825 RepID=UPI001B3537BD|nr:selection and upkeep of intraepithelial T-cells protein 8-like [Ochotona curzoniae]